MMNGGTFEHVDHRAEAALRAKPQILPAIGMVPPLALMPFHLPLRSLQPGFAVTSSRKITRQIQVKGDLDSAKSHSAQDLLKRGA